MIQRKVSMAALAAFTLGLGIGPAAGASVTRVICLRFDLNYVDNGPEHYWADNSLQPPARGMHIKIVDAAGSELDTELQWLPDDPVVGVPAGCKEVSIEEGAFTLHALNRSTVNGLTFTTYAYEFDPEELDFHAQPAVCDPGAEAEDCSRWTDPWTASTSEGDDGHEIVRVLDEGAGEAAHASATFLFQRHHFNIGTPPSRTCCATGGAPDGSCSVTDYETYTDDDIHIFVDTSSDGCPGGGGSPVFCDEHLVHPNGVQFTSSCPSKWLHGHEYGHLVVGMRMGHMAPNDVTAPLDGCQGSKTVGGDVLADETREPLGKEYTSVALREGWGDFIAAWMWNENGGTECISRGRLNNLFDYDIDGASDNSVTWDPNDENANTSAYTVIDCGPDGPWVDASWGPDFVDASVSVIEYPDGVNWLSDAQDIAGNGCDSAGMSSDLNLDDNRSTLFDVVRMFWSLHSDPVNPVDVGKLADIYIDMCPRDWDQTDAKWTAGTTDAHLKAPLERLLIAAGAKYPELETQLQDAAIAHLGSLPARWEINHKGDTTFGAWSVALRSGDEPWDSVIFADFNGDAQADAFEREASGRWRISYQTAGGFAAWHDVGSAGDTSIGAMAFGDFNGDGRTDVYRRLAGGRWQINYMNDAGTSFGPWHDVGSAGDTSIGAMAFGDFNGDGRTDVYRRLAGGRWQINYMNDAGTSFGPWHDVGSAGDTSLDDMRFADFDGDGRADVYRRLGGGRWQLIFMNDAGTSFGAWHDVGSAGDTSLDDMRFADFDGDGRADVYRRLGGGRWQISYMNDAGTSFGAWVDVGSAGDTELDKMAFADFDGDRKTDVVRAIED